MFQMDHYTTKNVVVCLYILYILWSFSKKVASTICDLFTLCKFITKWLLIHPQNNLSTHFSLAVDWSRNIQCLYTSLTVHWWANSITWWSSSDLFPNTCGVLITLHDKYHSSQLSDKNWHEFQLWGSVQYVELSFKKLVCIYLSYSNLIVIV